MNLETTLSKFKLLEEKGRLGILRRSFNFTDEPKFWMYSCVSNEGIYESSSLDEDKQFAKIKALGEYIERYCLDNPQQDFFYESFNKIEGDAVNPSDFVNFRDKDLNFRKKEYLEKIKSSKIKWVEGRSEPDGSKTLIPAQLVYVDYDFNGEPMIRPRVSTGAATHETVDEAFYSGILENIERDSYMISFLSKKFLPKINLRNGFSRELDYFKRYLLDLHVFETTTELGIPSFMCFNLDKTGLGPAVSVGLKSDLDPRKAIIGSINESQQVRQWIRNLWIQRGSPKVSRSEDIKEIEDRGFYWYGLDRINDLDYLLNSSDIKDVREIQSQVDEKKDLVEHLKEKGIDTYSVDLTAEQFREEGFYVVRAIQPQLHPLFLDEAFPCYWSERLEKELNGREVNKTPHPFM
jgi:ribosomal protein S12 methylthiotransferase accessory factor|tara:strand:- start:1517 stop:2737 length:1221 start_codon:yes stop_codon:yes gene_type:complete